MIYFEAWELFSLWNGIDIPFCFCFVVGQAILEQMNISYFGTDTISSEFSAPAGWLWIKSPLVRPVQRLFHPSPPPSLPEYWEDRPFGTATGTAFEGGSNLPNKPSFMDLQISTMCPLSPRPFCNFRASQIFTCIVCFSFRYWFKTLYSV